MNFKKFSLKIVRFFYFDDTTKLDDFNIDNILIGERLHANILTFDISCKTLKDPKPLRIRLDKIRWIH